MTAALTAALEARSVTCHRAEIGRDFGGAAAALGRVVEAAGPVDAIVVALAGRGAVTTAEPWQTVLADHRGLIGELHTDAAWARAAADYAAASGRGVQLVTLTDATTPAGRSRAQSSAQLARAAGSASGTRVTAFAASVEAPEAVAGGPAAELVTHLLTHPEAHALAGAELAVGHGWIGLRRHPRATGTVAYGGPAVPGWLDSTLREMVVSGPSESFPGRAG
jgi:hypothetical protein